MTTIFIDDYAHIVPKEKSKYEVILSGSYRYSHVLGGWQYHIKSITPPIPLSHIYSKEKLINNE